MDPVPKPRDLYNRILYAFSTVPDGTSIYRHLENELSDLFHHQVDSVIDEIGVPATFPMRRLIEKLRIPVPVTLADVTERSARRG